MATENILEDNPLLKFIQETVGEIDFSIKPISLHPTYAVYVLLLPIKKLIKYERTICQMYSTQ